MRNILFILFFLLSFSNIAKAKIRIAYIQGGEFINYQLTLNGTALAMNKMGIIEKGDFDLPQKFTAHELWNLLSEYANGDKIEFVKDAFYSGNWNKELQKRKIQELKRRIETKKDIDLIFAFGTTAGIDTIKNIHNVNIMSFAVPSPIEAGISKSLEYSGNDFIHATVESNIYFRQLKLFHDIFNFNSLGICYEDTQNGKKEVGYSQIVQASKELGFTLYEKSISLTPNKNEENINKRIACHKELAKKVDAMYLTSSTHNNNHRYMELLTPFIQNKIPTFAQLGPKMVKLGALMSMASTDFLNLGYFETNVIMQLINGKKLGDINQHYEGRSALALNIRMALEIGWDISFELLAAVDEVYQKFEIE